MKYLIAGLAAVIIAGCVAAYPVSWSYVRPHQRASVYEKPAAAELHGDSLYFPQYLEILKSYPGLIAVDTPPKESVTISPGYPERAAKEGKEGDVWVKILVGKNGVPVCAIIMKSSDVIFNEQVLTAAMNFRYEPAIRQNAPIAVWLTLPFRFRL
ncbi:MAG: energy transducer TonB [Bacteroidetes bacterium]|nr:energy transducer TonB [Bacteroidota bacterium]